MKRRNTPQLKLTYDTIKKLDSHVSAYEVYLEIKKENKNIGRTTVYRNLQKLCESGDIIKVNVPDGAVKYDLRRDSHFHGECLSCGNIFDISKSNFPEFKNFYDRNTGFMATEVDIYLKGYCKNCRKKEL